MADIFWRYGEEGRSRRIAKAIIQERKRGAEIKTTTQLSKIVEKGIIHTKKISKEKKNPSCHSSISGAANSCK